MRLSAPLAPPGLRAGRRIGARKATAGQRQSPHGDRFIVGFSYDVTNKPSGKRMQMTETALYTVRGGKIVREEFFDSE